MNNYICKIGHRYYYRRRVPEYVKHLDKRNDIKISLKTTDRREACAKALIYNDHMESFWKSLIRSGGSEQASQKYRASVALAKAHGFVYKTTHEIAESPLEEIIERLSAKITSSSQAEAILGGVDQPTLLLSDCDKQYWDLTSLQYLYSYWKHRCRLFQ